MRNVLALAFCVLLLLAGCGSSPEVRGSGPTDLGSSGGRTNSRWSRYLQVMTDLERITFLDIQDDFDREMWIRRNGIDVRADLDRRLARGISVEAAKRRILESPDEVTKRGDSTMLFYSRYNTESRTNFWLLFQGDQLVSWNAHTEAQMDRERHLLEFESSLMQKFNTVLRRGMGVFEIRQQARNARANYDEVVKAHAEKLSDPENYKGVRGVSSGDYLIAEDVLYALKRDELFAWFLLTKENAREPDHIVIHRPYETHQYYLTHVDLDGTQTQVIVEFIFMSGQLQDWFVYHER